MANRFPVALFLCATLGVSAGDAPPAPLRLGVTCIGNRERVASSQCSEQRASDVAYLLRTAGVTNAARLRDGQPPPAKSMRELTFSLHGEGKRWPAATTIELTDATTTWQWSVASSDARTPQTIRIVPGEYRLTITVPGHQRLERVLKQESPYALGKLELTALRRVSGVVLNPERRPVAGCAVLADGTSIAFSDARGRFDAELPVPAPKSVTLAHPQFAPRVVPLLPEGDASLGSVQLSRGGSISCTVDRRAIGDDAKISAKLFQFVPGESFRPRDAKSLDAAATLVSFASLDPGDYGVLLEGLDPLERMIVPVTVTDGVISEVLVAILPWRLKVTAMYGDEPLRSATVHLLNSGSLERRVWNPEIRLDASGSATVEIWQRGRILGELRSDQLQNVFVPAPLEISTEDDHAKWDIVVPRMRAQGTVVDDATGEPVAGARVIHDSESVGGATKLTDVDGRFAFDLFEEGRHTFRVDASEYLPADPISVLFPEASGERRLEFRLKKGKTIALDVRDSEGRAVAGAVVIDGCAAGMSPRGFRTDANGSLALPSSGGRHRVCVLPMQGSFALAEVEAPAEASDPPIQIRVPPPQVTMRISAKTTAGVPIAQLGLLLVHNGRVVPPVVVQTIAELQRSFARTDPRGELVLTAMPAGQYEFYVYTSDEEAISIAADRRNAAPVYSGYLAPGEAALDLTIEARD